MGYIMTKLKCSVINCFHNRDKLCCLNGIKVAGDMAEMSDGTACASFKEKHGGDSITCGCGESPNESVSIECEAKNCVYNCSCKCTADAIDVEGKNACTCNETRCETFKMD